MKKHIEPQTQQIPLPQGRNPLAGLNDPYHVLLTEKQAAEYLGLTARALQQRRYNSLPPASIKLPDSSAVRYRLSVLMEFVAQGEIPLP